MNIKYKNSFFFQLKCKILRNIKYTKTSNLSNFINKKVLVYKVKETVEYATLYSSTERLNI